MRVVYFERDERVEFRFSGFRQSDFDGVETGDTSLWSMEPQAKPSGYFVATINKSGDVDIAKSIRARRFTADRPRVASSNRTTSAVC